MTTTTTDPLRLLHDRDVEATTEINDYVALAEEEDLHRSALDGARTSKLFAGNSRGPERLMWCCARHSCCRTCCAMFGVFCCILFASLLLVLVVMANNGLDENFQYTFDVERKVAANHADIAELSAHLANLTARIVI